VQINVGGLRSAIRRRGSTSRRRDSSQGTLRRSPVVAKAGPVLTAVSSGLVTAISNSPSPLWLLGVQCAGSAAAALCGAIVLSQKLHQAADRADDGEVCGRMP